MRQDQFYMTHEDQQLRMVEYDHLWGSPEPNPQLDIFFGPRYVDDEAFCETFEVVGYYSPENSYMLPTNEVVLDELESDIEAEGYVETAHRLSRFPGEEDRVTK